MAVHMRRGFGWHFGGWGMRAGLTAAPSAIFALSVVTTPAHWIVIGLVVVAFAAGLAALSHRFGLGESTLARFVRALRLAVWVRCTWIVIGASDLALLPHANALETGAITAAPLFAEVCVGAGLVTAANQLLLKVNTPADPDAGADSPDPEADYPEHRYFARAVPGLKHSLLGVGAVTALQGGGLALQLALLAIAIVGLQRVRRWLHGPCERSPD